MSFETDQLAKIAARTKNATNYPTPPASREEWNPQFDEATEGLFGKRWLDEDVRPATAMRLREVLGNAILGNLPRIDDLGLLISVVHKTRSEVLRDKAIRYLSYYLRDAISTDYKTEIADLLAAHPMPAISAPKLADITAAAINQHRTKTA